MALSMYDVSVPVFVRALTNLSAILEKGREYAAANGIPDADLIGTRLVGDMDALPAQIQRASDSAKGAVVRIAGIAPVAMPDTETSFDDLQARIAKTIALLQSVTPDQMDGREEQEIELTFPNGSMRFSGRDYLLGFVLPNFFFHITTAYAILRHRGVPIGKMDYLGQPR